MNDINNTPKRPPIGTQVKHAEYGKGKIFSYQNCDAFGCGVEFPQKGQWCVDLRELTFLPNDKATVKQSLTVENQQRIAIAEACGWTEISDWAACGIYGKHPRFGWTHLIPDYLNDLNAMHEAEKCLTYEQRHDYATHFIDHEIVFATAAQRADAFIKTLGKL
jgi:hypothetical protein